MRPIRLADIKFHAGYNGSCPEDYEGDIMASGSRNLIILHDDRILAFNGLGVVAGTGCKVMFPFSTGWAGLGTYGSTGKGSVFVGPGLSLWYIGAGGVYKDAVSLSTTASTTLNFRLLRAGSYTAANTGPYSAGMAVPSTPTLAVKSGSTGSLRGAIAAKITEVRSTTGAESNASTVSGVVTFNGETARLTIPALGSNGSDKWRIYLPKHGFGDKGGFYFWKEIADSDLSTIDTVARSYEVNYTDADLKAKLAPIDNNVPPVGVFGAMLEGCSMVIGCYGDATSGVSTTTPGVAVAVSLPNHPEAYPADNLLFLPSQPVGVIQQSADSHLFIFGTNYLAAAVYTGANPLPVALQVVWPMTGFPTQNAVTVAEGGRLYGFSSQRGMVRMGGDGKPDYDFARPVLRDIQGWTASNVVVGWDADHQMVCFMHGRTILAFNTANEKWSAPIDLTMMVSSPWDNTYTITAAVSNGTKMTFSAELSGSSVTNLYNFNTGSNSSAWKVYSSWRGGGNAQMRKTLITLTGAFKYDQLGGAYTINIYTNYSITTAQKSIALDTSTVLAAQHVPLQKINVRNAKTFCVYMLGAGGDAGLAATGLESGPVNFQVDGVPSSIR